MFSSRFPYCFVIILSLSFLLQISADVTSTGTPKPTQTSSYNVKSYTLNISYTTQAPDGFSRRMWTANGQFPGPLLTGWVNDVLKVNVFNSLTEPTTLHWHGFLQNGTPWFDGSSGVTQCPIPAGSNFTYEIVATVPGSTWWHGHHLSQYMDGLWGPLVIYDPKDPYLSLYDEEFIVLLTWHYHREGSAIVRQGSRISPDSGLINGATNTQFQVQKGKKYRFRIVNTSGDGVMNFSIDGHMLTVIEVDGYNVRPYITRRIATSPGQRYSVIVECNQTVANYYMRADMDDLPSPPSPTLNQNVTAIVHYANASTATPTPNPWPYTEMLDNDMYLQSNDTAPTNVTKQFLLNVDIVPNQALGGFAGVMNNSYFIADFTYSTLDRIMDNYTTTSVMNIANSNAYTFDNYGDVIEVVIINLTGERHPFHVHGHRFWVVASGSTNYTQAITTTTKNAIQRDTSRVPANGYTVFRFTADNPGVWGFHCHIDFHYAMGMAVQFIELPTKLKAYKEPSYVNTLCSKTDK